MSGDVEYLCFLDSDDWIEYDAVQKLYYAANRYHADIVSCAHYDEAVKSRCVKSRSNCSVILKNDQIIKQLIDGSISNTAWDKLYRKELFSHIRYQDGMIFEDIATTYKIVTNANVFVFIPNVLVHYRIRSSSLSREYSMKCLIDYWNANYMKYKDLTAIVSDSVDINPLIKECLLAIARMWRGYAGCSKHEQHIATPIINQMVAFTNNNKSRILNERIKDYANNIIGGRCWVYRLSYCC